jgi:hypothetical protein
LAADTVKEEIARAHGILESDIEQVDILGPSAYANKGIPLARVAIAMEASEVGAKLTPSEQPPSLSLAEKVSRVAKPASRTQGSNTNVLCNQTRERKYTAETRARTTRTTGCGDGTDKEWAGNVGGQASECREGSPIQSLSSTTG